MLIQGNRSQINMPTRGGYYTVCWDEAWPEAYETYVYVAGPYSPLPNYLNHTYTIRYREHLDFLHQLTVAGWHCYCPVVHFHDLAHTYNLGKDIEAWKEHTDRMLLGADMLFILGLPGWSESPGVEYEYVIAQLHAFPVYLVQDGPTFFKLD